jgi:Fic family protein
MGRYIHDLPGWPEFAWNHERLSGQLADVRHRQGRLLGRMDALGFPLQAEASLQTLTLDVLKSSEIEGEQTHGTRPLNERQRLLLNRLLDGFEGKLTSSTWAKLAKCSQDTALRDMLELVELGILVLDAAGGRSTSYSLTEA